MSDFVPSLKEQGVPVRFIASPFRTYNSGCIRQRNGLHFVSRRYNPEIKRCDLIVAKVGHDRAEPVKTLEIPTPDGIEHLEDARVVRHDGSLFVAYTEGRYNDARLRLAVQKLARLGSKWNVEAVLQPRFGGNGKRSEKNWQFFSHDGALHFVHSIEPHVVVRMAEDGSAEQVYESKAGIRWPFGTLSGGTPPVRVGDHYVSFFHSYTLHPTRDRRYTMSAYEFEATPPFRITKITDPILRASNNDPSTINPYTPHWRPLVVFPCGALLEDGVWTISAGVNDSYDALLTVPHSSLEFRPVAAFTRRREFCFVSDSAAQPIRLAGTRFARWTPFGPEVAGHRAGKLLTTDPEAIAGLDGRRGVRRVDRLTYDALR